MLIRNDCRVRRLSNHEVCSVVLLPLVWRGLGRHTASEMSVGSAAKTIVIRLTASSMIVLFAILRYAMLLLITYSLVLVLPRTVS